MTIFTGTSNNEVFTGSTATADEAVIDASLFDLRFTLDARNRWVATSAATGSDTLDSVETLRLSDAVLALRTAPVSMVNAYTSGDQSGGSVSARADGGWTVAWHGNNGSQYGLFLQSYGSDGVAAQPVAAVNAQVTGSQVATLAGGTQAFTYLTSAGLYTSVNGRTHTLANTNDYYGRYATLGDTVALSDGGYVVVFQEFNTSNYNGWALRSVRIDAGGLNPSYRTLASASYGSTEAHPAAVALAGGAFAVAWFQDNHVMLRSVPADSSVSMAAAVQISGDINPYSYGSGVAPALARLADGGFVAAWSAGGDLVTQRFDASATAVGANTVFDTGNGGTPQGVALAGLSDGSYVAAWLARAGGNAAMATLLLQRFNADGSVAAPLQEAAQVPANSPAGVSLAALADGGFVLTWQRAEAGNSSPVTSDVLSQRFDAAGLPVLSTLTGTALGDDLLYSGSQGVRLEGGAGDDRLVAGSGNDVLDGGSGADTLDGGLGNDTYIAGARTVIVDAGGTDTVFSAEAISLADGLEHARLLGSAAVNVHGNDAANFLQGNAAANLLDGGAGADTLAGGGGADTYLVDDSRDLVIELAGAGTDTVASTASFTLGANVENLHLAGAEAVDATGNALNNQLLGNAAANVLDGRGGNDTMAGGEGNDTYVVSGVDMLVEYEGEGTDTVRSASHWTLGAHLENLELTGSAAVNGSGNALGNRLTGNAGANVLDGGAGADTMDGGNGADTYVVDDAGDVVTDSGSTGTDLVRATASHTLGSGVENLTLLGMAALDGNGNALANVLRGNNAANALFGDAGNDLLHGNGGNDTLSGGSGADTLAGGTGDDVYVVALGGTADIREAAGQGLDTVRATVSAGFTLGANLENLELSGGNVFGMGNELGNAITGTDGANRLNGGAGADTLTGGLGNDSYVVDNAGDQVVEAAAAGVDEVLASLNWTLGANLENGALLGEAALQLTGNALANRLVGNAGTNTLRGEAGNDLLLGGAGHDTLQGGAGADSLDGGAGNDLLDGGLDLDVADYRAAAAAVRVNLALTTAQDTGGAGVDTLAGIESAFGSHAGGDTLTGTAAANTLWGLAGNDTLTGAGGDDRLLGDEGDDLLVDGLGNTLLDGGNGFDLLSWRGVAAGVTVDLALTTAQATGGAGLDTVLNVEGVLGSDTGADSLRGDEQDNRLDGGGGNDTLAGGDGNDTLEGGAGVDTADYRDSISAVRVDLRRTVAQDSLGAGTDLLVGVENLLGSDYGGDQLTGDAGANLLNGCAGNDTLTGGAGNDTYVVDAVGDVVNEASTVAGEIDTVMSSVSWTLGANLENLLLTGAAAVNATGNAANNVLTGNAAANILNGGAGTDLMTGGAGNDTYVVDSTGDVVKEASTVAGEIDTVQSAVSFTLGLNLENLTLTGTAAINGTGNGASNTLVGNAAANVLDGGAGTDRLTGGAGADTFRFAALSDLGLSATRDVITDFTPGQDRIDLSAMDANAALAGDQAFSFLTAFTNAAGQVCVAGNSVLLNTDTDLDAEYEIQLLGTFATPLTAASFVL